MEGQGEDVARLESPSLGGPSPSTTNRIIDDPKGLVWGCAAMLTVIVVAICLLVNACSTSRAKQDAADAAKQKAESDALEADYQKSVADGSVCADGWGGSNIELVDAVKARLRDPDSFEHVQTVVGRRNSQGQYPTLMHYRAKNGFGGYNTGLAHARLTLAGRRDCRVAEVTLLTN